jgi:sulfofructose kinase
MIQEEYGMKVAAMTLGSFGSIARMDGKFCYSPAFVVNCVDTTGAGDVFHGAYCYGVLEGLSLRDTLDLSNAMAALNCTAIGARGGIADLAAAKALMARAERRTNRDFEQRAL